MEILESKGGAGSGGDGRWAYVKFGEHKFCKLEFAVELKIEERGIGLNDVDDLLFSVVVQQSVCFFSSFVDAGLSLYKLVSIDFFQEELNR